MEFIYGMVKSIIAYVLLNAVLMNLLGKSSYKKYIGVFSGLLLILVVITPVLKLLGIQEKWEINYRINLQETETEQIYKELSRAEEWQREEIEKNYKDSVSAVVSMIASSYQIEVEEVQVELEKEEYGKLEKLVVKVSEAKQTMAGQNEKEKALSESKKKEDVTIDPVEIEKVSVDSEFYQSESYQQIQEYKGENTSSEWYDMAQLEQLKKVLAVYYQMEEKQIQFVAAEEKSKGR